MSRLVDIDDERFWNILFDEACVEGLQAEWIKEKLEEIVAFNKDEVIKRIKFVSHNNFEHHDFSRVVAYDHALEIIEGDGIDEW